MKSLQGTNLCKKIGFVVITVINIIMILSVTALDAEMKGILWSDADGMTIIEKMIFVIAVFGVECAAIYKCLLENTKFKLVFKSLVLILLLMVPMMSNFITGQFVGTEGFFDKFQKDSESLALTEIMWNEDNYQEEDKYGLHAIQTIFLPALTLTLEEEQGITNGDFTNGYSNTVPGSFILINSNRAKRTMENVKTVEFADGIEYTITGFEEAGDYLIYYTDCEKLLNSTDNGGIRYVIFRDSDGERVHSETKGIYTSQIGLQGKIWRSLAKVLPYVNGKIGSLHMICAVLTAMVFTAICLAVAKKYNVLMAAVFYITFWLSPWTTAFARNLYWVEFTWFVPVLVGLIASIYTENKKIRIVTYIAMFVSVFIKSMCGYEYLSTVLIASMMFLATDFICALMKKDKEKAKLIFRTTFILSIVAVAGFLTVLLMHAGIRGEGSIINGLTDIWNVDVARRAHGDPDNFSSALRSSLEASVLTVVRRYFRFSKEVIFGVPGEMFRLISVVPLIIFIYEVIAEEKADIEKMALYVLSFVATISFFVLVKGHSYIHTHINFVLWYFGFVQMCLYIIVDKVAEFAGKYRRE